MNAIEEIEYDHNTYVVHYYFDFGCDGSIYQPAEEPYVEVEQIFLNGKDISLDIDDSIVTYFEKHL